MRPIDIGPADLEMIRHILRDHVPGLEVRAFGSRVSWTARETSDLDLALMTDEPLSIARIAALRAAFTESDLPFRVDIADWASTSESFRRVIEAEYAVLDYKRRYSTGEWIHCTLADACSAIDYGLTASASNQPNGPRFLRITDIVSGQIDWNAVPYVTVDDSTREKYRLYNDDIVVARTGASTGVSAYIKDPPLTVFASYLVRLQAKSDYEARFLAYYLKSEGFWEFIRGVLGDKSAQPNASASTMTAAPLHAPRDKTEQRAIAHILGTLDDKIELNRRMNTTLEALARALFTSWFVDFDPVRAKMEGRDTGLPQDIADLFPDQLMDSELGEIPEGWPLAPLPELIEVNPKRALRKGVAAPYLDMANMPTGGHVPVSIVDRPCRSGMRFANGDTLVARITPCLENGKTAFVDFLGDGEVGWGSTEYIVLKSKPPIPDELAYCLARSPRFREFAVQNMSGTSGRQRVPATALSGYQMCVPPAGVAIAFGDAARPLLARASAGTNEFRALGALRDTLLPKLVSGELRVNVLEAAFGRGDRPVSVAVQEA